MATTDNDGNGGFETSASGGGGGGSARRRARGWRPWVVRGARVAWVSLLMAGVVGGYGSALVRARAHWAAHHHHGMSSCHRGAGMDQPVQP